MTDVTVWYRNWYEHLQARGPAMSSAEMEASARLTAVLLCGEQSAIEIFSTEVKRGRAPQAALAALADIERDEHLHEQALSAFCKYLPDPADGHRVKRRAQVFFARLGKTAGVARHFGRISHLDAAVCRIMWHVENSALDSMSPLKLLASHIKRDEARHVAVSRKYAEALGLDRRVRDADSRKVTSALVGMLTPLGDDFETVGVDPDRLFSHLRQVRQA